MPSANKHLRWAYKHRIAAKVIETDPDTRAWSAVALFYSAHELAHAVFDADPGLPDACRHPDSHANQDLAKPGTNTVIKRHFRTIEHPYMDLYSSSRGIRYKGQSVDDQRYEELLQDFEEVRQWSALQLSKAGRTTLPEWLTT